MPKLILLMVCSVFLVSCIDFEGTLSLDQDITLKDTRDRVRNIPAGPYNAEIEPKRDDKFHLEFRANGKKRDYPFHLPEDFRIPRNGEFVLPASISGQDYDLAVETSTEVEDGRSRQGFESCTYTTYMRRCYRERDRRGREYRRCYCERTTSSNGERRVEYFVRTTTRSLEAIISIPDGEDVGTFGGEDVSSERIYTHEGICRGRFRPEC